MHQLRCHAGCVAEDRHFVAVMQLFRRRDSNKLPSSIGPISLQTNRSQWARAVVSCRPVTVSKQAVFEQFTHQQIQHYAGNTSYTQG